MPMMSLYKNEVEKKTSTSEKNTANAIMRKMNEVNKKIFSSTLALHNAKKQ